MDNFLKEYNVKCVVMSEQELQNCMMQVVEATTKKLLEEFKDKLNGDFLTIEKVSEKFSVNKSTLNRWEHDGYLVPHRIGGRVYYSSKDIIALFDKGN